MQSHVIICTWKVGSGPSPEAGQNSDYSNLAPPPPPHNAAEAQKKKRTIAIKKLLQQNLMHSAEMDFEECILRN